MRRMHGYMAFWILALVGCGGGSIDREDELGEPSPGREVVVVDGVGAERSAKEDRAPRTLSFDPQGEYTVQIGLYKDAQRAGEIVRLLSAQGYPAYALPQPGAEGMRVRIGYFKTRREAHNFGMLLKEERGLDFWIDHRAKKKK